MMAKLLSVMQRSALLKNKRVLCIYVYIYISTGTCSKSSLTFFPAAETLEL